MSCEAWARGTRRLVGMAAAVLERPAGTVTGVFGPGAEREGAYRFLENDRNEPTQMEHARDVACARRAAECGGIIVVPVDKTSVQLSDRTGTRDFGSVGTRRSGARGVQVVTALPLDLEGAPLGIAFQKRWARSETPSPRRKEGHPSRRRERDRRPPEERESFAWIEVLLAAEAVLAEHAPGALPWFQGDRETDFWGVHLFAAKSAALMTVRMNKQHRVRDERDRVWPLMQWLRHRRIQYSMRHVIPAHDGRPQREASLRVRFGQAELALETPEGLQWVPLSFVQVDEARSRTPTERISWILGTTFQVDTAKDAIQVIENYERRWRIESFHRTWKTGSCDIESSQLQSMAAFERWAIVTSSMAARAEAIKHYSRAEPEAPATVLFSRDEIDTMIRWRHAKMVKKKPPYVPGETPTLQEMTRWVAELGGYMGSPSRGPPGAVTIMRGLEYLDNLVEGAKLAQKRILRRSG